MFQDTCLKFFSGWIGVMIDGLLGGFQLDFHCALRTNSCGFDCVVCVLCVEPFSFQLCGSSDWTAKIRFNTSWISAYVTGNEELAGVMFFFFIGLNKMSFISPKKERMTKVSSLLNCVKYFKASETSCSSNRILKNFGMFFFFS